MRHDVVVVGGGLAGWTAAASAAGSGRRVLLVDPAGRGGRAATDVQDGFSLNRGAHALYDAGAGVDVLERLGIRPTGGRPPLSGGKARLRDQVGALPSTPAAVARTSLLSVRDRARVGKLFASVPRWRPAKLVGLSTNQWFDQLGLDGDVRDVAAMFIRLATYAADFDVLSADVAAGQLQRAIRGVRYLDGGWVQLTDGLRAVASDRGVVERRAKVRRVEPTAGGVELDVDDERVEADVVVLAAGSPQACASLLPEAPAAWLGLGDPSVASCLDVGLPTEPDLTTLLGVDRPLYAIRHTPSAALAPEGAAVVHAMHYLRADEHLDPTTSRAELEEHLRVAGVHVERATVARYLHRMVTVSAMPTADRGGLAGRPGTTSSGHEHVLVAGDWVGPEGYLADGSLASGEAAGRQAAARVDARVQVS